jgi:hypothetical protein
MKRKKPRHKWSVRGYSIATCERCGCRREKTHTSVVYVKANGDRWLEIAPPCKDPGTDKFSDQVRLEL